MRRIAKSTLNGSTIDILNVIRNNANAEYQSIVPAIDDVHDIPKVGAVIYGTPAIANQFINALVNRIAFVKVTSATFNNKYAALKKGQLEFGETIEEVFVDLCKAMEFNPEKGAAREHKRYLPIVHSAFHIINWRVIYPITIQDEDLKKAFLNQSGVQNLIMKIVNSVYTAAEYDEFLLFKYLIIKNVAHGHIKTTPIEAINNDATDSAIAFRGTSNSLEFMSREYNEYGVLTNTPRANQHIFMDAKYNALFDVNVLASAFNMDKADFMGRLQLVDSFATFDNERFDAIRSASDGLEEVTAEELTAMQKVKAIIFDEEWFQVYDQLSRTTQSDTASGLYWTYFHHVWKTVSSSPFSNAVAFIQET